MVSHALVYVMASRRGTHLEGSGVGSSHRASKGPAGVSITYRIFEVAYGLNNHEHVGVQLVLLSDGACWPVNPPPSVRLSKAS